MLTHSSFSFSSIDTDGELFDASQYAFFGGDVGEEIELGGLLEEDDNCIPSRNRNCDDEVPEYHLFEKDEVLSVIFGGWIVHICFGLPSFNIYCLFNYVLST